MPCGHGCGRWCRESPLRRLDPAGGGRSGCLGLVHLVAGPVKTPAQKALDVQKLLLRRHWFVKECAKRELPEPIFEHRFDPVRRWRFDMAWPVYRVALETEGGVFGKRGKPCPVCKRPPPGAHSSIEGILRDIEKYNAAALGDWLVLRVVPKELFAEATFAMLQSVFTLRAARIP